jgi:serine/threonine protein kinase
MITRRVVALKFLTGPEESEENRLRFLREARAASAVVHPSVVEVLDVLEAEGKTPTLVLELLEGESLGALLERERRLSVAQTADLLLQVVSAVGSAHALGIVHRDLKPDNIFLQRGGDGRTVVKVLDFGIAKVTAVDGHTLHSLGLTSTGALLGTPMYMSPEQVFGETDLDHRADIWAIGIILYQCLTGVLPTAAPNLGQVFKIILTGEFKSVRALAPDTPTDLAKVIHATLSRDRSARPSDLGGVLEALQRHSRTKVPTFGPPLVSSRRVVDKDPSGHPREPKEPEEHQGTLVLPVDSGAPVAGHRAPNPSAPRGRRRLILLAVMLPVFVVVGVLLSLQRTQPVDTARAVEGVAAVASSSLDSDLKAIPLIVDAGVPAADTVEGSPVVEAGAVVTRTIRRPPSQSGPRPANSRLPLVNAVHPEDPYGF